ncbi:MAG TPA: 2-dehydropantoate 2-reductase [Zeimonas sp.]|nr:2-dehydropantoate 2-reductase [Zeimonas sp.]
MPVVDRPDDRPQRVVVFGAGAVGCYFGAKLAEAGTPVTLIGRAAHMDAVRRDGLLFDSGGVQRRIRLDTDTGAESVRKAHWVLFCVKTRDTEAAARQIAPLLRPDAVVVSLQNGVDNVERLRTSGIDALGAVVYVAAAMAGPGHLRHSGRGDLVVGEYGGARGEAAMAGAAQPSARTLAVARLFEGAGVPCRVEADVRAALWDKLVANCAFNAISALTRSRYGPMIDDADVRRLMRETIDECVRVAHADGVALAGTDAQYDAAMRLGEAMREASSSMEQDLSSGRRTEIDSLNGYVCRRGEALGIATPANRTLTTLVRLLERSVTGG